MKNQKLTGRRDFLLGVTVVTAGYSTERRLGAHSAPASVRVPQTLSVQEAIDRILEEVPGPRKKDTVDTVKVGDANQPLTGIVTTFLATCEVVKQSIELGSNLIITHEPTFFNHLDEVGWLAGDSVYSFKRALIESNGVVIWRFHDYWHEVKPDPVNAGLIRELGWETYTDHDDNRLCQIPEMSLGALAAHCRQKVDVPYVRVVGDLRMPCQKVGILPGAWGGRNQIGFLMARDVDVLICGEVSEWETNEYVRDALVSGRKLGLVILGHVVSEEPGMNKLAEWLRPRFPGVSVTHVPARDPFHFV